MAETGETIAFLEYERQAIERKLETRGLAERDADRLLDRHEALLQMIASMPAHNLRDLEIKVMRLAALLFPGAAPDGGVERTLIRGMLDDIKVLNTGP